MLLDRSRSRSRSRNRHHADVAMNFARRKRKGRSRGRSRTGTLCALPLSLMLLTAATVTIFYLGAGVMVADAFSIPSLGRGCGHGREHLGGFRRNTDNRMKKKHEFSYSGNMNVNRNMDTPSHRTSMMVGVNVNVNVNDDDYANCNDDLCDNSKRTLLKSVATGVMSFSFVFPQRANAMYTDPNTKIVLPSEGEVERCIPAPSSEPWSDLDADNPFVGIDPKSSFARLDETPDSNFYTDPRFTEHVDDNAVRIMTSYIQDDILRPNDAVLDLCSSWTSHISPETVEKYQLSRVAGLGMNEKELRANAAILNNDYIVQDLNAQSPQDVKLPYDDESFHVVLCQLSIDYLIHPLEVMKEVGRILKPGGKVVILFSNRLFLSKAVGLWTGKDDLDHVYTVASYLNYCNGGFTNIVAKDLSKRDKKKRGGERMIIGDPLYAVVGVKTSS